MKKLIDVKFKDKYPIIWCSCCDRWVLLCPHDDCDASTCNCVGHECNDQQVIDDFNEWSNYKTNIEHYINKKQYGYYHLFNKLEELLIKSFEAGLYELDKNELTWNTGKLFKQLYPQLKDDYKPILFVDFDKIILNKKEIIDNLPKRILPSYKTESEFDSIPMLYYSAKLDVELYKSLIENNDVYIIVEINKSTADKVDAIKKQLNSDKVVATNDISILDGDYILSDKDIINFKGSNYVKPKNL